MVSASLRNNKEKSYGDSRTGQMVPNLCHQRIGASKCILLFCHQPKVEYVGTRLMVIKTFNSSRALTAVDNTLRRAPCDVKYCPVVLKVSFYLRQCLQFK